MLPDVLPPLFDGTRFYDYGVLPANHLPYELDDNAAPTRKCAEVVHTLIKVCGWPITMEYNRLLYGVLLPTAIAGLQKSYRKIAEMASITDADARDSVLLLFAYLKETVRRLAKDHAFIRDRLDFILQIVERAANIRKPTNLDLLPKHSPLLTFLEAGKQLDGACTIVSDYAALRSEMEHQAVYDRAPFHAIVLALVPPTSDLAGVIINNTYKQQVVTLNDNRMVEPTYGFVGPTNDKRLLECVGGKPGDRIAVNVVIPSVSGVGMNPRSFATRIRRDFMALTAMQFMQRIDAVYVVAPSLIIKNSVADAVAKASMHTKFVTSKSARATGLTDQPTFDYTFLVWEPNKTTAAISHTEIDEDGQLVSLPLETLHPDSEHGLKQVMNDYFWMTNNNMADKGSRETVLKMLQDTKALRMFPMREDHVNIDVYTEGINGNGLVQIVTF